MGEYAVADVAAHVERIANLCCDPERAHSEEDALHLAVLTAIAEGHPDAQALAAAAIETRHIDFERWCA